MARFVRATRPPAYKNSWKRYKPFLRFDFRAQCAYCEKTELYARGHTGFGADHFRPKSNPAFHSLRLNYENLYYCCAGCNSIKNDEWPTAELVAAGFFFVDPCVEDPFKSHIKVNGAGELEAQTPQGDYTKRTLRLDRKDCLDFRKERISARRALDDAEKVLDGLLTSSAPKERKDELKRMLRVVAQLRRCWAQFVDPPPQQLLHHIPKKYRRDVKIPSGAASV